MPLDAIFMSALADELKSELLSARIDKIQQPERDQLVFSMRGTRNVKLLFSCAGGSARMQLSSSAFENPAQPPMFCMLLRKHLTGAKLTDISQTAGERILDLTFEGYSELGTESRKHLVFEIVGSRSNLILCDEEGRMTDCLHRSDSETRRLLPGLFYRPPEPMDKADPMLTDGETLKAMLRSAPGGMLLDKWLCGSFVGISPLVCRELTFRACGSCDVLTEEADGEKLAQSFEGFTEAVREKRFEPTLLTDGEKALDFSYMPICQYGDRAKAERARSFSELLETFYSRRDRAEHMRQRTQSLTKTMRNIRDRTARKLENQRRELSGAADREKLRINGDLITANMHAMRKGDRTLKTQNFYDESCAEIEIRLDPLLTPQENAAKYYKSYKKAKTAESVLTEQIEKGERELDYCESVLDEIARAESPSELAEIRQELMDSGYISKPRGKQPKKQQTKPMHFVSQSGLDIYVGKNNVQNDILTFKSAMRTDMWLHTQKIHGSHVIIACAGKELDDASIELASSLAAYYSKARGGKNVPVDYTLVKYVKKPSGGKPGAAIYTDYKTIFAEPKLP